MRDSYEGFRGLLVWQKAQALAVLVSQQTSKLPRTRSSDVMVSQIVRSAGSVPANIAEGYGRYYEAAYRNHLSIARGSLFETESWVDLMFRLELISNDVNNHLIASCHEVGRLLTAQMKNLSRGDNKRTREPSPSYEVEFMGDEA